MNVSGLLIKSSEMIFISGLLSKPSRPFEIAFDKGLIRMMLVRTKKITSFKTKNNRLFIGFIA
jgi:hypothetical protein